MRSLTIKEKGPKGWVGLVDNPRSLRVQSKKDKDGKYLAVKLYYSTGEITASFGLEEAQKLHSFLDYFCRK